MRTASLFVRTSPRQVEKLIFNQGEMMVTRLTLDTQHASTSKCKH